jgi:hypothetical protein
VSRFSGDDLFTAREAGVTNFFAAVGALDMVIVDITAGITDSHVVLPAGGALPLQCDAVQYSGLPLHLVSPPDLILKEYGCFMGDGNSSIEIYHPPDPEV